MCLNRRFLVACLIIYAMFQFYQAFSSFIFVFVESRDYYQSDIKSLTRFQIVGLIVSSVCLITGALKSNVQILIAGLCYLLYKIGFVVWHFGAFYEMTLNCRDTSQAPCDPNRLKVIYQHILISSHLVLTVIQTICLMFVIRNDNRTKKSYNIDGRYCRHMEESAVVNLRD